MEKRVNTTHSPFNPAQDHYQEGSYGRAKLSYKHRFTEREWLERGTEARGGGRGREEDQTNLKPKQYNKNNISCQNGVYSENTRVT